MSAFGGDEDVPLDHETLEAWDCGQIKAVEVFARSKNAISCLSEHKPTRPQIPWTKREIFLRATINIMVAFLIIYDITNYLV